MRIDKGGNWIYNPQRVTDSGTTTCLENWLLVCNNDGRNRLVGCGTLMVEPCAVAQGLATQLRRTLFRFEPRDGAASYTRISFNIRIIEHI